MSCAAISAALLSSVAISAEMVIVSLGRRFWIASGGRVAGFTWTELRGSFNAHFEQRHHATPLVESVSRFRGAPRQAALGALVAASYYLSTQLGFLLKPHHLPISTFWPPNAILLAAYLLLPRKTWWVILAAVLPAHLLIQLPSGVPPVTALGWFISNNAEALAGAACIRHFKEPGELFESFSGVLTFVMFGVILAPLASSFIDAAVVVGTGYGADYWRLWTARLFSNMLADLTIAPTIAVYVLNGRRWLRELRKSQIIEGTLLFVALVALSVFLFGMAAPSSPALMFIPLPLIVWLVVRFEAYGLYPSLLAMSTISIWDATHGLNPFILAPMPESILAIQIFLCTIALPMMLLAAVLAERRTIEESLRQSRARLIDAQEQERRRIARELHDDIGQQLTVLELELDRLKGQSLEIPAAELDKLYQRVVAASAATRTISHQLHSAAFDLLHVARAIGSLCHVVEQEKSISIAFVEENVPGRLDPQVSLCLYRIAQGALQNVARHSHAHRAEVTLRGGKETVAITIKDDGVGFPMNALPESALGLASMEERVSVLGGSLKVNSAPRHGTEIAVTLPLSPATGSNRPAPLSL